MNRKAAVLLLAFSAPLALADRDAVSRKGRKMPSSLLAVGDEPDATPPDMTQVKAAADSVQTQLGVVETAITTANTEAQEAMKGAVNWKTASAEIPVLIAQVHAEAKDKIWTQLQNVAPMIGGAEKKSMADLLKGIVEDVSKQKTTDEADSAKKKDEVNTVLTGLQAGATTNLGGQVTAEDATGVKAPTVGGAGGLFQIEADRSQQTAHTSNVAQVSANSDADRQQEMMAALLEAAKGPNGKEVMEALHQVVAASKQQSQAAVEVDASGAVAPRHQ